jgi:hypothetical protein
MSQNFKVMWETPSRLDKTFYTLDETYFLTPIYDTQVLMKLSLNR